MRMRLRLGVLLLTTLIYVVLYSLHSQADSAALPIFNGCEDQVSNRSLLSFLEHWETSTSFPGRETTMLEVVGRVLEGKVSLDDLDQNLTTEQKLFFRTFRRILEGTTDRAPALNWIESRIKENGGQATERHAVQEETQSTINPISFVHIPGGWYDIPKVFFDEATLQDEVEEYEFFLPYDFEVMDVLVTREMWLNLMGYDPPPEVGERPPPEVLEVRRVNGCDIEFAPHCPVLPLKLSKMAEFANLLSIQHGLPPAYLVKKVDKKWSDEVRLTVSHFRHAKGFRLPSHIESIILNLGLFDELRGLSPDDQKTLLEQVGVFGEPLGQPTYYTHVRQKRPLRIGNGELFDLVGLVADSVHPVEDGPIADRVRKADGKNGPGIANFLIRGGNNLDHPTTFAHNVWSTDSRMVTRADVSSSWVGTDRFAYGAGFRLVRTLPSSEGKKRRRR